MKYFSTEEWYLDYTKSIVENYKGDILRSLPQGMLNRIKDLPDSAKEDVLEREYNVLRLHRILRRLGWLKNWIISVPPDIKLQGPSANYSGFARIVLDVVNYIDTRTTKLRKLGMEAGTYIDRPLTHKIRLSSFFHYRYEIEEVLVKLGYAEKYKYTYYWKVNAQRLKSDDSSFFHIIEAAGGIRNLSKEAVTLIKRMFNIQDEITPVQLPITIEPTDVDTLAILKAETEAEIPTITPIQLNNYQDTPITPPIIPINRREVQPSRLKIIGKIDLPERYLSETTVKPLSSTRENTYRREYERPEVRGFRITGINNRKRGARGQFYEAVDENGKPVSLLGFDDLTLLNVGESIKVSAFEKISKNGQNIYYVIRSLGESDGEEY
jgi:hypothetical protein